VNVGSAFATARLSSTDWGTPSAGASLAGASLAGASLAAASLDAGAADDSELLPLLEQAAKVSAPTAITAAGQSLRDVYIDTPCFDDPHVGLR
jgi:hypothetical protein